MGVLPFVSEGELSGQIGDSCAISIGEAADVSIGIHAGVAPKRYYQK
jgi:hypothetical protein